MNKKSKWQDLKSHKILIFRLESIGIEKAMVEACLEGIFGIFSAFVENFHYKYLKLSYL